MTGGSGALALVEGLYEPRASLRAWLDAVATLGARELDRGLGVIAYTFALDARRRVQIGELAARGATHAAVATFVAVTRLSRPRELERIYFETGCCSTLSDFTGVSRLRRSRMARTYGALSGIRDFLAIKGIDGARGGVALGVFLPELADLSPSLRETWEHVGAHLCASHRLALRPAPRADGLPQGAEAVLTPGGELVHAEGPACEAREALEQGARAIDRARALGSLELWPALCDARWSLVDHFDTDGRCFVVARENAPAPSGPPVLTPRERAVVACVAQGHAHKLVAYELGVSVSTVRTLEHRARRKLGVRSRAELIELVRTLM